MDTIIVPLDGSELSEQALPYATLFGKLLGADLCLLHVITEGEQHEFIARREQLRELYLPYRQTEPDAGPTIRHHDESYLAGKLSALHGAGIEARTEVVFGVPADAIVAAAERSGASMIVMSTHGRGSVGRWLVGSVAHKVIRMASCPVLAVRGPARNGLALRRILVPLDGSALAREAMPMASELARRTGATLVLLMVLAPLFGLDPSITRATADSQGYTVRERMLVELERIAAEYHDIPTVTAIAEGFVAETICREAVRHEADLIVMTAQGQGGRRRLGLGSVTERVLHDTKLPVLITRSQIVTADTSTGEERQGHTILI